MAACTFAVGTADTGATPNTSGAFTPTAGDLLVVIITASDTVQATATLTSSVGMTFTQIRRQTYRTSLDSIYAFVSDQHVTKTASQTVTFDTASDAATGTNIMVYRVSGMTRAGLGAILQQSGQNNQAAAGTPAPVFGASCLTGNPTIGAVGNSTNPAGMTTAAGWTEPAGGDIGYATPATGTEVIHRDSGFTGTTITWGSTSASAFGSLILELDSTAAPAPEKAALDVPIGPKRKQSQIGLFDVTASLLLTTLAATAAVVHRGPVSDPPKKPKTRIIDQASPNLLTTTLGTPPPAQDPFKPETSDRPIRKAWAPRGDVSPRFIGIDGIPFDGDVESAPKRPRWTPPLDIQQRFVGIDGKPFTALYDSLPVRLKWSPRDDPYNLQGTTLAPVVVAGDPFLPEGSDRPNRKPWSPRLDPGQRFVGIDGKPVAVTDWMRPILRPPGRLDEGQQNLLTNTLAPPVIPGDPFIPLYESVPTRYRFRPDGWVQNLTVLLPPGPPVPVVDDAVGGAMPPMASSGWRRREEAEVMAVISAFLNVPK